LEANKQTRERDLETILTICVALVLFYLIGKNHHSYFLTLAFVVGAIGLLSKYLTAKIAWAWWKVSEVIGSVMSKVILSVIFFVFLVPIAFLSRLFRKKDDLQLKRTAGVSYYFTRNHTYRAKDLENGW
jgi:Saxitoxin biosynthesis operon protein SxtJ